MQDIIDSVLQRAKAGKLARFIKVKAHIGIKGNESADQLAVKAASLDHCDIYYSIGNEGLKGVYWPCTLKQSTAETVKEFKMSNLQSAVKEAAKSKCQTGNSNRTQYVQFWEAFEKTMLQTVNH